MAVDRNLCTTEDYKAVKALITLRKMSSKT